jgi:predicted alpha/beta-hydrolase family hydrolase
MQRWAGLLRAIGPVEMLDYPYMLEHRGRPDPMPRLVAVHRAALERVRAAHGEPVVLIGKSMGSRVGCHLSLEERVLAVVCLGYPLCGGGDRTKLRDQVLREMTAPILFVQGTRDALCPLDLLADVRAQMRAPNRLEIVEGGDHSLAVTKAQLKASGETQADVEKRLVRRIAQFVAGVGKEGGDG